MFTKTSRAALSRFALACATALILPASIAHAGVLELRATNAFSGEALAGLEVYAMQLVDGSDPSFAAGGVTDSAGKLSLDLDGLGSGARYTLISEPYNGGIAQSAPIESPGIFAYRLGALRVTAINGNDGSELAAARVGAMRVEPDGTLTWQTEGVTDAEGRILLDLPELDSGVSYKLFSLSPLDGSYVLSEEITSNGEFSFQVGAPLLEVSVLDGISQEPLAQQDLLLVELGNDDEAQWVSTGITDESGRVTLEVAGLGSGRRFQLYATVFNEVLSTSPIILEPGAVTFEVGRLRVSVVDGAKGSPIPGYAASVMEQLADGSLSPVTMGETDAGGQIRFDLDGVATGRSYFLQASSPVDGSIKRSAPLPANGDFQFQVGSVPLSVTVTDASTGNALAGETVYVLGIDASGSQDAIAVGETDSEGRVQFDVDAPADGVELVLATNPFDNGWVISQPVSSSGSVDFSAGGLPVTLRNAGSGDPLAERTLHLARRTDTESIEVISSAVTNAAGQVHFDAPGLGEGVTYTVLAQNVFGAGQILFSPWVSSIGAMDFLVSSSEDLNFDAAAPVIEIEAPAADSRVSAAGFLVTGFVSDEQPVESVVLELDAPRGGSVRIVASLQGDQWTAAVPASSLSVGSQTEIAVLARDRMGNESRETLAVDVVGDAGAPQLEILSHRDFDYVPGSGFLLSGRVSDDIGVQELRATARQSGGAVLLDEIPVQISPQGSWALPVSYAPAGSDLQLELRATDLDGNESIQPISLQVIAPAESTAHAISRLTFGATPDLLAATRGMDAETFISEQLNPQAIDESALELMLTSMGPPMDDMGLQQRFMLRALHAERQLLEKMTWFWENHFNTSLEKSVYVDYELRENEGFRQHALGQFRDLLEVSATSPAMLLFLDNVGNTAEAPNENYARELLELHTLGFGGGYSDLDVSETARVLTGWWVRDDEAQLYEWAHDDAPKEVLGTTISASDGREEISRLLDLLAAHPSTARHVCNKLLQYFVTEEPGAASLGDCANVFMATDGDMGAVVGSILHSDAFRNPADHHSLAKTPLEFYVSLLRALDHELIAEQASYMMYLMGMPLLYQGSPEGYSESGEYWLNANQLSQRALASFAVVYAEPDANLMGPMSQDPVTMLSSRGYHTADAMLGHLVELTNGIAFGGSEWELVKQALTGDAATVDLNDDSLPYQVRFALTLLLNAPGFQLQ